MLNRLLILAVLSAAGAQARVVDGRHDQAPALPVLVSEILEQQLRLPGLINLFVVEHKIVRAATFMLLDRDALHDMGVVDLDVQLLIEGYIDKMARLVFFLPSNQ